MVPEVLDQLKGVLKAHPAIERVCSTTKRVNAQLHGFEDVCIPPRLLCEISGDLTLFSLKIHNVVHVPNGHLVHELVAGLNYRLEKGTVGVDVDGEVVLKMDSMLPQGVNVKELKSIASHSLKAILDVMSVVRRDLLDVSMTHLGLPKKARDLALSESEVCWHEDGAQQDESPMPYKALTPLLEDLKSLAYVSYKADNSLHGVDRKSQQAMDKVDPLLSRAAQLNGALIARLSVTDPTFLPLELRALVTDGAQTTGRLLGFLLAQHFIAFEDALSVKQLGGLLWPETWPRNAGDLLSTVEQMIGQGLIVASLRFERDQALEVDLDCILRPSSSVLGVAITAMGQDVIGQADINAMQRQLEEGGLSSLVPACPEEAPSGSLSDPVKELICGRCGASYMFDGNPCSRCRA